MIGVFMGLVATAHFAVILVPVSRDSKIWSAVGIPFERAVLYHAIAGHLAFFTTFLHAFLMVSHWVNYDGWSHAWHESVNVDHETHGGVDTPMGWMAFICAMPMWITSTNYVRRRWYSLFKLTHWMFIGVFVFSVMHVSLISYRCDLRAYPSCLDPTRGFGVSSQLLACDVAQNCTPVVPVLVDVSFSGA